MTKEQSWWPLFLLSNFDTHVNMQRFANLNGILQKRFRTTVVFFFIKNEILKRCLPGKRLQRGNSRFAEKSIHRHRSRFALISLNGIAILLYKKALTNWFTVIIVIFFGRVFHQDGAPMINAFPLVHKIEIVLFVETVIWSSSNAFCETFDDF